MAIWTSTYMHWFQHGQYPTVGISRGVPKFYTGPVDLRLAPSWSMLKASQESYNRQMMAILKKLDPQRIYAEHDGKILLCWEPCGVFCHRRMVAEWLEQSIGEEVNEWGFTRDETPRWREMESKEVLAERGIKVPYASRKAYAHILTGPALDDQES